MRDVRGSVRRRAVVASAPLLAVVMLVFAAPASARTAVSISAGDSIPVYDVVLTLRTDGILHVRETITYDFARDGEHGIVRRVPFRRADRLYDVRHVRASSSTGAPARAKTLKLLHDVQISVGDRRRTVRGRQAYVIEYEVAWAFTPYPDHDELVWEAVGTGWDVPIGEAAVRVEAPVPLRHVSCRAGGAGATTRCRRDRDGPYAFDFTQRGLRPHEGVTVRVRLPKRAVAVARPRYAPPRWAGSWPGTAALALAVVAAAVAVRRPLPRRGAGIGLLAAGTLLVAADAADDVLTGGPWAFSLGDGCVAGLAFAIMGAGIEGAHRFRTGEPAAPGGRGDYS